jgi:hypothetical protein
MKLTPAERTALSALGIAPRQVTGENDLRIPVTTTLDTRDPVYVTVPRAELLAWCERRLETRETHKNKALCAGGGLPTFTLRTTVYGAMP